MSRVLDLDALDARELEEWASLLRLEASRARRTLTPAEAWTAWSDAPLTAGWRGSQLADVGRVRIATRRLITIDRWRPDQIVEAMTAVAVFVSPDRRIAEMAVAAGIEDAEEILGSEEPEDAPW